MSDFKDDLGREWTLRLDFARARKLRDSLELDFVDFDGILRTFAKIDSSVDMLMQVIGELTAAQRQTTNLSEEEFCAGFCGDSFEAARVALEECVVNFSPPRERENLTTALANQSSLRKRLVQEAVTKDLPG